jgi:hypothetical protein
MTRTVTFRGTAANRHTDEQTVIHVRFEGRSFDLPVAGLGVEIPSDDAQVKRMVAGHLEIPANRLAEYTVDRHANGNITLRPQAVFVIAPLAPVN